MTALEPQRSPTPPPSRRWISFRTILRDRGLEVQRRPLETLQLNLGPLCNQACHHCHVEAGPQRTEAMSRATAERVVELLSHPGSQGIETVDITGGAPELNPSFRFLVRSARRLGKHVIDRCNLTVLRIPGQEDTAEFLAENRVEIVASLPCYSKENVEKQRGKDVFENSIAALRSLNALGYGLEDSPLALLLVYNPLGAFLPPPQRHLEAEYKKLLAEEFGIAFDRLLTITNMPISRFRKDLDRSGGFRDYMKLLTESFDTANLEGLMCRDLLSVGWDGRVADCDFNQALSIPVPHPSRNVADLESFAPFHRGPINFGDHCYGCAAGAGSSCRGALR